MIFSTKFGNIHYEVSGEGRPLLLIHDAVPGESAAGFERCAKRLSAKYRVYTLDLLGFGQSDKPAMDYSAYLFASLINEFISGVVNYCATASGVIESRTAVIARGRGAAFSIMAAALNPGNFRRLYLLKPKGMPAAPMRGIARAFFIGADRDLRYSLEKGFLDVDYMRALGKLKIPVRIMNGECKLCNMLMRESSGGAVKSPRP